MAPMTVEITHLRAQDVLWIAVLMFAVDLAMSLWKKRGTKMTPAELVLLREYNEQVRVVNRLKSVETFVEQAKAIRKMNATKKQMQELAVERMKQAAPSVLEKRLDQLRTPVLLAILMVLYWRQPLATFPQGYMLPIERLVALPGFPLGSVSAVGWAMICRRVGARLLG